MPKYLLEASYTLDGTRGVAKEGGSPRRAAATVLITPEEMDQAARRPVTYRPPGYK